MQKNTSLEDVKLPLQYKQMIKSWILNSQVKPSKEFFGIINETDFEILGSFASAFRKQNNLMLSKVSRRAKIREEKALKLEFGRRKFNIELLSKYVKAILELADEKPKR